MNRYTEFFSNSPIDKLFNTLACFAEKSTKDFQFSPNSYKCKLSILKDDMKVDLLVKIL